MAKKLDDASRDLLAYRPKINFVEPEVLPGEIDPLADDPVQLEDIAAERDKVRKLAKAVNALATATQARVDEKAKGIVINLDPKADAQAIMAMRRKFPDADPTQITYDQYKSCKEDMRKKGEEIGKKATISPEDVEKALQNQAAAAAGEFAPGNFNQLGGYNTPAAIDGGLRPELNTNAQIIEPLDIDEFQDIMIKVLVNFLWKNFIKPVIPLPPGVPGLPDTLISVDKGMINLLSSQGINMSLAGEDPPKKQEEPEIPSGTPEGL